MSASHSSSTTAVQPSSLNGVQFLPVVDKRSALRPLAASPRWVVWKHETIGGKPKKPPYPVHGPFRKLDLTKQKGLGTRAEAMATQSRQHADGIGIVTGPLGTPKELALIAFDVDACFDASDEITPWAASLEARVRSYAELSPSKTGLHVLAFVTLADLALIQGAIKSSGREGVNAVWDHGAGKIELYTGPNKYVTVTGNAWNDHPIARVGGKDILDIIHQQDARKGGKPVEKTTDQSRSGKAYGIASDFVRRGLSKESFLSEVTFNSETAEWAEDTRQVNNTWTNATKDPKNKPYTSDADEEAENDEEETPKATKKKKRTSNLASAVSLLREHPLLTGIFYYDEMLKSVGLARAVPEPTAKATKPAKGWKDRRVTKTDVLAVKHFLQRAGLRTISTENVREAIALVAESNRRHPLREWMDSLEWDGERRIHTFCWVYLGATEQDAEYLAEVARLMFAGLVGRTYHPGCKFDYCIMLGGKQGTGKSTFCKILGGDYYGNNLPPISDDPVRTAMHLRGIAVLEIDEMKALQKASVSDVRSFMTRAEERYLPKHEREEVIEPRSFIPIITYNPDHAEPLKDVTGGRRFLPIMTGTILTAALEFDLGDLIAEAVHDYKAGGKLYPDRELEERLFVAEQEIATETDERIDDVRAYLERIPTNTKVKIPDIIQLGLGIMNYSIADMNRIAKCLVQLGWKRGRSAKERFWEADEKWKTDQEL